MKTLYCFIKYNGFGNNRFVDIEDCLFGFDKDAMLEKASSKINVSKEELNKCNGITFWDEGEYIISEISVTDNKFWTIYYENLTAGSNFFVNKNGTNSHIPCLFLSRDEAESCACFIRDECIRNNVDSQFLLYPIKVNC